MNRFSLLKSDFVRFLKSDKQMLLLLALIYLYTYVIDPIREYANFFTEPIGIAEGFVTMFGNGFSIVIITISFLMLIIDFPDMGANATFVLHRTGRKRWLENQCVFVFLATLYFMTVLLLFSVITTADISFVLNAWSNAATKINSDTYAQLRTQYPLGVLDLSVLNNFRPYTAALLGYILMFLQLTFFGQLQICLTVRYNRIIAMCVNLILLVIGLYLWNSDNPVKWLFTIANANCGWHYDHIYNITKFPIEGSVIYLSVLNITVFLLSNIFVQKKSFL